MNAVDLDLYFQSAVQIIWQGVPRQASTRLVLAVPTGRAVELFLKQLCERAIDIASSKNARTLSAAHM